MKFWLGHIPMSSSGSGHSWKARGDVSCVCLVVPLHRLVGGLGGAPSSSLGVSTCPVHRVLGDTEMGWLCIFAPQHFIDILQQTGLEWRVCAFPCGGNVCPLREGKNHMGWGVSAGVPHLGACVDSGGGQVS